jgi:transcriptional regulator
MNKPFNQLKNKMSARARNKANRKLRSMLAEMALRELRKEKGVSQEMLAFSLDTRQANISRLERRTDMHISTLRNYVEAMGGTLQIIAQFPEGDIQINQFMD